MSSGHTGRWVIEGSERRELADEVGAEDTRGDE